MDNTDFIGLFELKEKNESCRPSLDDIFFKIAQVISLRAT